MRERNLRQRNRQQDTRSSDTDEAPDGNLERIRAEATADIAAADAAIERALSGDSMAFIAANRQSGGQ
jgi:hypothetical protein